jgi:hypothetical protein
MPGNNRDRTASCEAPRALPLSYVPLTGRGRTRTFDLMVSEVTALFTTGKGIAGERTTSALGRQNAGLPCRHERPDPRHAGPRGTGSTVRFGDRRDSNPRFPRCEVSEVFTTSERMPARVGGDFKAAQRGGKKAARSGKAATGNTKRYQQVSRRSCEKWARRQADSFESAPPSVDRANASRAVPSGGPRASDRRAKEARCPGIRVSHAAKGGGFRSIGGGGET